VYIKDSSGNSAGPNDITIPSNQSFNLAPNNSIVVSISLTWNPEPRSFRLQIPCLSANTPIFLSAIFTVPAGGTPPALSFTPDGITANTIQTVAVSISNSGSTAATGCNVSLDQLTGTVYLNNPPTNFSIPGGASSNISLILTGGYSGDGFSQAKLKVTCSQGSWTSTNFYKKLGN
jgi:hypothetical protein